MIDSFIRYPRAIQGRTVTIFTIVDQCGMAIGQPACLASGRSCPCQGLILAKYAELGTDPGRCVAIACDPQPAFAFSIRSRPSSAPRARSHRT